MRSANLLQIDLGATDLPPDPDALNGDRAKWALVAVHAFQKEVGTDPGDAISDLIADLFHLADRTGEGAMTALDRAHIHYIDETKESDR